MERAPIGIPLNTRILAALFVVGACGAAALAQSDVPFRCHEAAPEQSDRAGSIVIDGVSFADGDRVPKGARGAVEAALKDLRVADEVGWVDEVEEVNVRGALQDAGYFEANAHVRAKFLGGPREERHFSVTVHIDGASWEQFRLMRIQFVAAKAGAALLLPENELRGKFEIGDGDLFDVAKIRRGIENLTRAYGARGYIDVTATPDFEIDHEKHTILLTVMLDLQEQYRIAGVKVFGLDPTAESTLRQSIVPGEIFDNARVEAAFEDIYEENKAVLPAIPAGEFSFVARDVKSRTVTLTADFRGCPEIGPELAQAENARPLSPRDGIQVDEIRDLKVIKSGEVIWAEWPGANEVYGTVELSVTVGQDGNVMDVKAISGPQELVAGAIKALKNSQFDPPASAPVTGTIHVAHVKN